MIFLKKIIDFYIQSSLHVALAISSLLGVTVSYFNINNYKNDFLFVFFGTILGYNFLKYFELFLRGKILIKENKGLIVLTLSSFIFSVYYFFQLSFSAQMLVFGMFILVLVYPFIRKLGWLKTIWVAFCVTELTVYLPLISNDFKWESVFLIGLQRFFIVIALLIPFEIYDSKFDDLALQTLPHRFGIRTTKIIGYIMIALFLGLHYFDNSNFILNTLIGVVTFLAIYFTHENRNNYFTSFWIESIPILWLIFT